MTITAAKPTDAELGEFIGQITNAQLALANGNEGEGAEYIEVDPKIINHFNRKGLGAAKYFIYKDIKVYPAGKADEIIETEGLSAHERMHGTTDGVIETA